MPLKFALPTLLLAFASLTAAPVHAREGDRNQPLNVRAATVNVDEKSGVAVYRGNVLLIQGSLRVEADRLEVRTDKNRRLQTLIATGRPARLRGFTQDRDDELQADAERIVYQAAKREIEISGNAWARQGRDEFRAEHIFYGIDDKQLIARGGADGRVHMIFQPRDTATP
ncbi:MAG TPA: lipopolysaccharide transport periplasmic protein LptA [Burkholderiales bacterium]|nr:lipopolysaccharide transport periplasmic protein LptA [Burkholderiales bacterium]